MLKFFSCVCCIWSTPVMGTGPVELQGLKTSQFVCVAMKLSHTMIGTMTISPVVDQIPALSLRAGQRVLEDKHVSLNIPPGRVEIYGYLETRPATVEQNN